MECFLSQTIDSKPQELLTPEELFDQRMRTEGIWQISKWRKERGGMGPDLWRQKTKDDPSDMNMTLFADDSANRVTARTRQELERRMVRGLERVFTSMKASRLKVNADKTTYMVMAEPGRRGREDLESTLYVQGEEIESVGVGKCLGVMINNNLTWTDQTQQVIASCRNRMTALYRITELLSVGERKIKAESVILSKLEYCLEATSTGRKRDLEALQGMQSQAARWVLGRRRLGWSLTAGLKQLCWLSMAQLVCYKSVRTALKVLQRKEPENLYERLTKLKQVNRKRKAEEEDLIIQEERVIIKRSWEDLEHMKASTRRAWLVRSLRWLERIPDRIKNLDIAGEASKKELKMWVKRHIHVRGDRIIWGSPIDRELNISRTEIEERDLDDEEGEGEGSAREVTGGRESHQDEASSEPEETDEVEVQEEHRVAETASMLLPPLGPVVWTALQQGEVMGHSQEQDTTGDVEPIADNMTNNSQSCCMSGEEQILLRRTEFGGIVDPVRDCQEDEVREAESQRPRRVVARRLLPPLGPVVWTASKKGEVEGRRRRLAGTGDMRLRCWETKKDVCMKWGSRLWRGHRMYAAGSGRLEAARARRGTFRRKGGVWVVEGGEGKTEQERRSWRKTGIG